MPGLPQFVAAFSTSLPRFRSSGTVVALVVLLIIAIFVIPVPWFVLDILITLNIAVSLTLLLSCLFRREANIFEAFPTILLFTTLYRLALNVSSTRLILLYGDQGSSAAGKVIQSFGEVVVRGDFLVGAIVFVVIATVNFLVVARGSARVAEVAARFSLDALPGKQLAIDADLRAGSISRVEAEQRREALGRETRFYGAMDGAMKFVQGDAIAGLIIAGICAFGGVSLGLLRGMEFSEAVSTFGVLTIGDGLVTIIPSLLISVCAGIVVTQTAGAGDDGMADTIVEQFIAEPRALAVAALAFLALGLVPGLPFVPFTLVSLALFMVVAYRAFGIRSVGLSTERSKAKSGDAVRAQLELRGITVELDSRILGAQLFRGDNNGSKLRRLFEAERERIIRQRGIFLPELHIVVNDSLPESHYRVLIREQLVHESTLSPGQLFATVNTNTLQMLRIIPVRAATHPLDHRAGAWVRPEGNTLQALKRMGVEVLETDAFIVAETIGAAFRVVEELFGLNEVHLLVDALKGSHPHLAQEVLEKGLLTYPELAEVLRRLVRERVSVRDLKRIFEGVTEFAALHPDREDRVNWLLELHSFLRRTLSRSIVADALGPSQKLRGFVLGPELEEEFRSAVGDWDGARNRAVLDPETETALRETANRMFVPVLERGAVPIVVMCASDVRRAVNDFFSEQLASAEWLRTIAFEELDGRIRPESIGILSVK